jgi:hypothetical protein
MAAPNARRTKVLRGSSIALPHELTLRNSEGSIYFRIARPPGAQSLPLISRNAGTSADSFGKKLNPFGDDVEGHLSTAVLVAWREAASTVETVGAIEAA